MDVLQLLLWAWASGQSQFETTMLWAARTLGFSGFLWLGEFTVMLGVNRVLLTLANVQVDGHSNPTIVTVTLCSSKTDTYG